MIRLVATDLDGTLWDRTCELRPDVRAALAELERRGVAVVAATGRRPRSARTALEANDILLPAVLLDGTLGEDFSLGQRFHELFFEAASAAAVLDAFHAHQLEPNVFVDHPDVDVLLAERPSTDPGHADYLAQWALIGPLRPAIVGHSITAFTIIGGDRDQLAPVAEAVASAGAGRATLVIDSLYGGTSLSVIPTTAHKWAGVAAFAARLGITADEVLAVGDAANDVELLAGAGVAVAVRGAAEEVLAEADHLIDPPGKGGWTAVLDLL
ncbi:MAG: HAD family hydrolase [Acidimicrobiales bacterium]